MQQLENLVFVELPRFLLYIYYLSFFLYYYNEILNYFSRLRPVAHRVRFLASHIEVNAPQIKNEVKFEIPKALFFHDTIS